MNAKGLLRGLIAAGCLSAAFAVAQSADTTAPAAPPAWSAGPIDFSAFVDGYYNFNANHPATKSYGNQLHNFDFDADSFSLQERS